MRRTTAERGYSGAHPRLRRQWATKVATGRVICARPNCGLPILPGQAWDLGHTDDRTGWTGPEHASCNRRAGAIKGNKSPKRRRTSSQPRRALITRLRW